MHLTLHGRPTRPTIATFGTWEPFITTSAEFVKTMVSYAQKRELATTALLVDPSPPAVVQGEEKWPYFQDVPTRVQLLRDLGIDSVGVIGFAAPDLASGAPEFFELISKEITLAEFWLRTKQSIGSGAKGGTIAVKAECKRLGCTLRFIKRFTGDVGVVTRESLKMGTLKRAIAVTRTLPTLRRPPSGFVRMAWHIGEYRAFAATSPDTEVTYGDEITLRLVGGDGGMALLEWPDPSIEYLRFTAGPRDIVPAEAVAV
jgi:hypothetical protein